MHSVELVVEGHGEVGGGAGGHVCDKGRLALVDRVVHVDAALADLHVLEARLHAAQGRDRRRRRWGRGGEHFLLSLHLTTYQAVSESQANFHNGVAADPRGLPLLVNY